MRVRVAPDATVQTVPVMVQVVEPMFRVLTPVAAVVKLPTLMFCPGVNVPAFKAMFLAGSMVKASAKTTVVPAELMAKLKFTVLPLVVMVCVPDEAAKVILLALSVVAVRPVPM